MIYRFIALNGELRGERVTIPDTPLTIGRGETCDLRLKDPEMALVHAVVSIKDDRLHIGDQGSMNRILVNHRELRESYLKHGDMIELGQTRFLVQAYVQADVTSAGPIPIPRGRKGWIVGVVLLFVLVAVVVAWILLRDKPQSPPLPPVVIETPPEPIVITPPVVTSLPINTVVETTPEVLPGTNETPLIVPPALITETNIDWQDPTPVLVTDPIPAPPETTNVAPPLVDPIAIDTGTPAVVIDPIHVETGMPVVIEDPVPEVDPLETKVETMFADAKAKIAAGNLADADELLMSIVHVMPTYVPAYVERAKRFQELGMLDMAIHQWGEVIRLKPDSTASKNAKSAIVLLERARREPTPPFNGWINVVSSDIRKFPESAESREMRLLTLTLSSGKASSQLDPSAVSVEVSFFDQDVDTGSVRPTRANVPKDPLSISGLWHVGETKSVTASYVIPLSQPEKRNYRYYGYEVHIFYQGALQAIVIEPSDLREQLKTATAGTRKSTKSSSGPR